MGTNKHEFLSGEDRSLLAKFYELSEVGGADREAFFFEVGFGLWDGVLSEVEDGGSEDGVGVALFEDVDHVLEVSSTAAGDDGDANCLADGAGELDVVAVFSAISIHGGEKNLACASVVDFFGPFDGVEPFDGFSATVGVDAPFG